MRGRAAKRAAEGMAGPRAARTRPAAAAADGTQPPLSPVAPVAVAPVAAVPLADPTGVPRWLRVGAAWSWRLLALAALLYVAGKVASLLYLVIVPCAAAILLTALLQPLASRLRRLGLSPISATWCSLLLALVVIGGALWLVASRVAAGYPALVTQVEHTTAQIQSWLAGKPFHFKTGNLEKLSGDLVKYLSQHKSVLEGTVLTGGKIVVEVLAGSVLCVFVAFFLIKDGARIWSWLTSALTPERRRRTDLAGHAAWLAVVHYVRGTVAIAAIHATVMGVTLTIMGAPLVAPLALLMFIAAFVPLVGVLIAGAAALLIVIAAKGLIAAVIVLGILIVMNQLEGHLLQPQVVGKLVRLHPLAVILVLAVAGVVAGIAGAVVAVPVTAALTSAVRALQRDRHAQV